MMGTRNLTFISALLIILLIGCTKSEGPEQLKFKEVTNKFAWNLYKELKDRSGNIIVSPIGLQLLLDILLQGANGTTANEIAGVLQHEADDKSILYAYKHFLEVLQSKIKTSAFKIATAVAVDQSFLQSEVDHLDQNLSEYFKTEIQKYNFKEKPAISREGINSWFQNHTEGEIGPVLPEGYIDSSTEMVMVSGAVFKGEWKQQFNIKNTKKEPFHVEPNVEVDVKMMAISGGRFRYNYNSKFGVQVVELPYTEEEYRMIIILPDAVGLAELETKLTYENLFEIINSVRETNVDIFVPRFRIKRSIKLVNILKKMGMHTAFSRHADFSRLTNSSISITNVMQRAKVVVNEKGTRAAAGSAVVITAKTLPPQMICNSPFMYIILKKDIILFLGSFSKP